MAVPANIMVNIVFLHRVVVFVHLMGMRLLLSILIIFTFASYPLARAMAQQSKVAETETSAVTSVTGDFQTLKHTKSGRIDKIIDGLTILLTDDTILRLASLDIPDFHVWEDAPHAQAALALLETLLPEGTEVMLYQTRSAKKGRVTRMKHALAHVAIKPKKTSKLAKDSPIWVNGALLANGIARVYTAPNAPEMAAQMFKIEQQARNDQKGLWAEGSRYRVFNANDIDDIDEDNGQLVLLEGIVTKAASIKNNVYLNFGENWKTDFTIMIKPALRKKLAREGRAPLNMQDQKLRVRGYLRSYNGPLIELEDTLHLESLPEAITITD